MSNGSDDLSDASSLDGQDVSGHKLARYLMGKSRGVKIDRLFGDKQRRISVQVELTKPTDKEQAKEVESHNTENITETRDSLSPLRTSNVTANKLLSPKTISTRPRILADMLVNAARSPIRVAPQTPEALSRQMLPQTPKSSQLKPPISSSDRLRRLSFKHLIGAGARRTLLSDLNATSDSNQFSQFEPGLKNHPECTSTPASSVHLQRNAVLEKSPSTTGADSGLQNIAAALGHTNREYSIQKGPLEGQIILTPAHLTAYHGTQAHRTLEKCEEQIKELTFRNVNVTYSPYTRARVTDHNAHAMILTDDEDESAENERRDQVDSETTTVSQQQNRASAEPARNLTFVRPRTPLHTRTTQRKAIARMDTVLANDLEMPAVSSSDTYGENALHQTTSSLPIVVQTRVQTEVFEDAANLDEVSFAASPTNEDLTAHPRKHKLTPEYVKDYKSATKKLKTKPKKSYANKSKRSLYSMKVDEALEHSSPSNCEVTSTNVVATPARLPARNAAAATNRASPRTRRSLRSHAASRSPSPPAARCRASTQRNSQQLNTKEMTPSIVAKHSAQRRSRSRSRAEISTKPNSRRRKQTSSSSSASSDDQSSTSKRQRTTSQSSQRSSTSSARSGTRSPTRLYRSASPQQSTTEELFTVREKSSAHDPKSSLQKQPSSASNSKLQNQSREGATTTALPNINKRGRLRARKPKQPQKDAVMPLVSRESSTESASCPSRRSQRERKPTKIEPYAIEIYTRAYFPERLVKPPKSTKVKTQKSKKPQNDESETAPNLAASLLEKPKQKAKKPKNVETETQQRNLQPRVKLRRLNLKANTDNNSHVGDAPAAAQPGIGIVSWLESATALSTPDETTHPDSHFWSREFLVAENRKDIEFRFYNNQLNDPSLGYIIFQPRAAKKMVALRHCSIKFVCISGRFKFTIIEKHSDETKEYICAAADAFQVRRGDRYGIENVHDTQSGQLMMIKEAPAEN